MKHLLSLSLAFIMIVGSISVGNAQTVKKATTQTSASNKIMVYYFHFSRRCNTCMSVEATAKQALETIYPDKVKKGEYTFQSLNLDDESSKAIAEKLGVGGQTLLVVCDDKKIDLTDKGFMNAHDLEKMKIEIKKAIEQLAKKQ